MFVFMTSRGWVRKEARPAARPGGRRVRGWYFFIGVIFGLRDKGIIGFLVIFWSERGAKVKNG